MKLPLHEFVFILSDVSENLPYREAAFTKGQSAWRPGPCDSEVHSCLS